MRPDPLKRLQAALAASAGAYCSVDSSHLGAVCVAVVDDAIAAALLKGASGCNPGSQVTILTRDLEHLLEIADAEPTPEGGSLPRGEDEGQLLRDDLDHAAGVRDDGSERDAGESALEDSDR